MELRVMEQSQRPLSEGPFILEQKGGDMETRFKGTSIALLVIFTVILGSFGYAGAQTITLKALNAWPKNSAEGNTSLNFFLESVEKQIAQKYPGELKINMIGGPEVVKIQDQVQAAQTGMVDIVHTTNATMSTCCLRPMR